MQSKERVIYADLLRIIAIFGVIMIHTTANVMLSTLPVGNGVWNIANALTSIVRFSVPLFFMVSGVFFLDPKRDMPIKKIFCKNILRLVSALVFWAVLYELYYVIEAWIKSGEFSWPMLGNGIMKILTGNGHFHLYFIYIMIGLYIVSPVLRVITKHATRRQIEYYLLLFVLFSSVLPFIFKIAPLADFGQNITRLQMYFAVGFVGYFLAGYYFNTYEISKKVTYVIYALGILSWLTSGIGTWWRSTSKGAVDVMLYEGLSPFIMFCSVAVFLAFKNLNLSGLSPKVTYAISRVAKTSFGIYLMHDFFNMLLASFGIWLKNYNLFVVVPLYSLAVFLVCMVISAGILKIPGVNKYLV